MKKLITTFAVTAMATVGLVGVAPSANAACDDAYQNCESTKPKVDEPVIKPKGKVNITVDLREKDGKKTIVPKGTLFFACSGPNGATEEFKKDVRGIVELNRTFKPKGAWTCSIAFEPNNPRKFGSSSSSVSFDNSAKG